MTDDPTKYYLKFVSRLYDLAGDFDRQHLLDVQRTATKQGDAMVATVADALCKLYNYCDDRSDREVGKGDGLARVHDGLRDILSSKVVFHSKKDLMLFARPYMNICAAPKDSRERLIGRILRGIEEIDPTTKLEFRKALEERIKSGKDAPSFVARWSKVIREL